LEDNKTMNQSTVTGWQGSKSARLRWCANC